MESRQPKLTYRIVQSYGWKDLEREVQRMLEDGWKLQGGVAGSARAGWAQALILPEESPQNEEL